MNRKDILQALEEISDARIEKAAQPPRKKVKMGYWYGGIAAVLAVAILLGIFLPGGNASFLPGVIQAEAKAIATAAYPQESGKIRDVSTHLAGLNNYFSRVMAQFLQDEQGNANVAFSPMNLYMALAMLAETTDGQTREEILSLLGATDVDSLRQQANELWLRSYRAEENPCVLANSVWLQEGVSYNNETMQTLAAYYFASSYENDFTAENAAQPIAQWIDQQTNGFLKEQTAALELDPRTVMALVSTVYLQADWNTPFEKDNNTREVFNGTKGRKKCTFMRQRTTTNYYWGEDYSAVSLGLNGGYRMWTVLPDEGKTTADLLQSGSYSELFLFDNENRKYMIVNLSMPKFDITCKQDMIEGLQELGVEQVFQMGQADFTPAFPDMANEIAVNKVEQATRVSVDEEGVTAASYVVSGECGSGMPPTEEVDFVLDRPFLFVITNNANMPLFAGIVNNP